MAKNDKKKMFLAIGGHLGFQDGRLKDFEVSHLSTVGQRQPIGLESQLIAHLKDKTLN